MKSPGLLHYMVFLWPHVRPTKRRVALSLLGLTVVSATSLLYPWLLKLMVDRFSGHSPSGAGIDVLSAVLLLVFAASAVIGYYQQVEMKRLGYGLRNTLRLALYGSLLSRSMDFHRQARVGELSSRTTEDIGTLQRLFSDLLAPAFQNTLFVSGCVILMAMLNPAATLMVIGLVALPVPFVLILSRRIRISTARSRSDHAHANALLEESLVAMREIKAFVREKLELRRYAHLLGHAIATEMEVARLHVKVNQAVYLLFSGALLAIFYTGTRRSFFPSMTLGDVIAFYFYSYTMATALLSVGRIYLAFQEFTGALGRVMELLPDEQPEARPPSGSHDRRVSGSVAFRHVAFAYNGSTNVMNDTTLTINAGQWQLITGPSGSGKSTVAGLIIGLYRPQRGEVEIDGVPVDQWDPGVLRRQIGYVGQDPMLIHGTLRENIEFSGTPAVEEALARAMTTSCLEEVLRALPAGLDTVVGERGYTLSGGQKARVAIARAILHEPPILVLDEATAGLEEEAEQRLWENLARARANRTTIIFSHHYHTIPGIYSAVQLRDGIFQFPSREGQDAAFAPAPATGCAGGSR